MVWGPCVRLGEGQEQCAIPKGEGFRTVAYVHRDAPSYSLTEPIDAEHLTIIPQGRNHRPPVNTFTHDRACRQNREHSLVFSQIRTLQRHFVDSCSSERGDDVGPTPFVAPQPIPFVRRLPFPVFFRYLPPRQLCAHHRQDATENGAMVVAWSSRPRSLRRQN